MPQKYKVFFNNNKLFLAKQSISGIEFKETFKNPDKAQLKEIIYILFNGSCQNNYQILSDDLKETWKEFKSFFHVKKAAGGVVFNDKNEKLFIKRRGFWDLPKGHLEKNEKNRAAALREVSEECGITSLTISKKLTKTYHTYVLKNKIILKPTRWYLMQYKGNEKLIPQTKERITDVKWANSDLEKEFMKNTFPSIMEVLKKSNVVNSASEPEAS